MYEYCEPCQIYDGLAIRIGDCAITGGIDGALMGLCDKHAAKARADGAPIFKRGADKRYRIEREELCMDVKISLAFYPATENTPAALACHVHCVDCGEPVGFQWLSGETAEKGCEQRTIVPPKRCPGC